MSLGGIFAGGVREVVGGVVSVFDDLHTSPEERAELEARVGEIVNERMRVVQEGVRGRMEMVARVIEAEAKHGNAYTKAARPSIVYTGLLIHAANALLPLLGFGEQIEVDPNFTYVWGGVCSVWVAGRSAEKMGHYGKVSSAITGNKPSVVDRFGEF